MNDVANLSALQTRAITVHKHSNNPIRHDVRSTHEPVERIAKPRQTHEQEFDPIWLTKNTVRTLSRPLR